MTDTLFKRSIIDRIEKYLFTNEVIVIHGARQVGKTSILMLLQQNLQSTGEECVYLDLEDSRYKSILDEGVDRFLTYLMGEGYNLEGYLKNNRKLFVLVDEIQYLVNPSSFLKLMADHHHEIKLIVSGSSSFELKSKFRNSLVGRTVNFEVFPLSFRETLIFKGISYVPEIPITDLKISELRNLYEEYALYGGYPRIVLTDDVSMKEKYLQQIIDTYIRKDIRDLADIRDISKFNHLVEILASQSGNLLNITELSSITSLAKPSVDRYIFLLEQTYIIRLVRPYNRNIRNELIRSPKIYFYDSGLLQMLWLKKLQKELLGPVFETCFFSDLAKYYSPEAVNFWRTKDKKEIDFILKREHDILPIEVKLTFPRAIPASFKSFWRSGEGSKHDYRVVSLYGSPFSDDLVYPWQL